MESIRSFIAIELPDSLKDELLRLESELKQAAGTDCARWVAPSGIHLTLKFLGNVSAGQIDEIKQAMERACRGIPPFQLGITNPGAFPSLRRVQIVWVGMGGELETLQQLVKQLESELGGLGFAGEPRPFTPHLTLARIRNNAAPASRQHLGELLDKTHVHIKSPISVAAISLMKSELTHGGAIYSRIYATALKAEDKQ
ncbi:MAG: RNA 2',3'-cyclic phosphodiesterase [Chloroflexota bacterium]